MFTEKSYKKRLITDRLHHLFERFPVVVISGARQVGKSTLLKHEFGDIAELVVFDPIVDIQNARQDPELFLRNQKAPLILDEIQYAPQVVPVLKRLVDENHRPGQFILTGSQQWEVMKHLSESLAGRAVFLDLEGFSLTEIAESIPSKSWLERWLDGPDVFVSTSQERLEPKRSVFEQIWRGSLPDAQSLDLGYLPDFFMSYIRTYLERDLRLMAEVQDLGLFSRFIRLVGALTAQEINSSQLGRELGVTPQTSARWLSILSATFQWTGIPAYSGNLIKQLSHRKKGYFCDTGLACYAQSISSPEALSGHPLFGAMYETAVIGEIRKLASLLTTKPNFYHWRVSSGAELDLILERDGKFFPIEIKASHQPKISDTRGIEAFRKYYPHLNIQPGLVIAPSAKFCPLTEEVYSLPWDLI